MARHRKTWLWVAGILVSVLLLWGPVRHIYFAIQIARSVKSLANGTGAQDLAVSEIKLNRTDSGTNYDALCYRPAKSTPHTAIIISAGISELGCYHPRLVALARLLAENGLLVVTPDIREFREFKIAATPIDQMLFWYRQIPTLQGGDRIQKTGFAGISFSGTLALMAASRPEIDNNAAFVVAIGPYCDLIRCTRTWFAAGPAIQWNGYYPTRFYARWIAMLAALDMLQENSDRQYLQQVLKNLLLQKEIPAAGSGLTPEGARWYALATMHPGRSDEALSAEIETYLTQQVYAQLDPLKSIEELKCPVFLIHGANDDLIPPEESVDLHRRISASHLLMSPYITHTHLTNNRLSWKQQLAAVYDTLVFCYQLARVMD